MPDRRGYKGDIMPEISPEPLLDAVLGYYRTSAIKAAVELDLFTAIGEGAKDVAAIAGLPLSWATSTASWPRRRS